VINVSVEAPRPVKIWACANKHAAGEPFRAIVTVRGAIVGRYLVISIGTDWSTADTDGYMVRAARYKERGGNNQKNTEASLCAHSLTPTVKIVQPARSLQLVVECDRFI